MEFTFAHNNINVLDLEKSMAFYREALQLTEVRRIEAQDGSFIIVFLGDGKTPHQLELTWLKDRKEPYNTIWATTNFIWPLRWMILPPLMPGMKKWVASALKTKPWEFTLSMIRTITGSKSSHKRDNLKRGQK